MLNFSELKRIPLRENLSEPIMITSVNSSLTPLALMLQL